MKLCQIIYIYLLNVRQIIECQISYKLRSEYPKYRTQYKSLWTPSYYCESVGHISEQIVKKYIEDQWLVAKKNGKYA